MKKMRLIYNPDAGDKSFRLSLDACAEIFQNAGYAIHLQRGVKTEALAAAFTENRDYDLIVTAGGDGSVNTVVNAMVEHGVGAPLGIIPAGTSNDFARHLRIPQNPEAAALALIRGEAAPCDVGEANGRRFINVFGAGLLTNVSHKVDTAMKDNFGALAYYIKGLGQLPNLTPIPVRITVDGAVIEEEICLLLILNSSCTAGFDKLSPGAVLDDGLFELFAVKAIPIRDLTVLFLKALWGRHIDDPALILTKGSGYRVECLAASELPVFRETDVDGESGPDLPAEVNVLRHGIQIIKPKI
ncbi:MAG: YegS/Rv2252/BmrU family lipid kinase [Firmicutes bacterium]|nr:YegS/Rv2252/BmrU family lipid kinase [Bacillota bacterium]